MLILCIDIITKCKYYAYMKLKLRISKHAERRCQQRGISPLAIETILDYGHFNYVGGAKSWSMNRLEKSFARHDLGKEYKNIEKKLGFLVVSHDGTLITAAHKMKRLKR